MLVLRSGRVRTLLPEAGVVITLAAAPFLLPFLGASPDMLTRVLIWGIIGLGFDLLFGVTGLLSFGQTIFYGGGGFFASYLLVNGYLWNVFMALLVGGLSGGLLGALVGIFVLRRTGIYFAMATVAFAEMAYFLEFSPLSQWTGGENGLPGIPTPSWLTDGHSMYAFAASIFFLGFVLARRIVNSPFGVVLKAIRRNAARAAAVGHNINVYKFWVFVVSAVYAGVAGALLGIYQSYMPPDAFDIPTSGQLVVQTVVGGSGTLIGPAVGAFVWLYLRNVFQQIPGIGALWKVLLGIIFVLCVLFLRRGIVGTVWAAVKSQVRRRLEVEQAGTATVSAVPAGEILASASGDPNGPTLKATHDTAMVLETRGLSRNFGGLVAVNNVSLAVPERAIFALIGPNGAGKSTLFRMLTGEIKPTSGSILFRGEEITGLNVTHTSQRGISKSYQIIQLFADFTVRDNLMIPTLARICGPFAWQMFRRLRKIEGLDEQVGEVLTMVGLASLADTPIEELPYGARRRLEIGIALATAPSLLLLDEPLSGLSPSERADIKALIRTISKEKTIVIVEHDMDAVLELADHVMVLHEGATIFYGRPEAMRMDERVRSAYLGGLRHEMVAADEFIRGRRRQ
jgi:branched-chain amino acid transport system permease protein